MSATADVQSERLRSANTRTVDALQRFYAMVIALAVTNSVRLLLQTLGLIPADQAISATPHLTILLFITFLSTVVVFYHGMNRHLDDTFVIGPRTIPHRLPLLFDIFVFLVEGCLLVAMGSAINSPRVFFYTWTGLLVVDILWGLIVFLVVRNRAHLRWIANNIVHVGIAWLFWLVLFPRNVVYVAVIEILRTVIDYALNWPFYFPTVSKTSKPSVGRAKP